MEQSLLVHIPVLMHRSLFSNLAQHMHVDIRLQICYLGTSSLLGRVQAGRPNHVESRQFTMRQNSGRSPISGATYASAMVARLHIHQLVDILSHLPMMITK